MNTSTDNGPSRVPWNKGKLTGQKPPLKLREIWAIRVRLQLSSRVNTAHINGRGSERWGGTFNCR
jgi:hypothetical protein